MNAFMAGAKETNPKVEFMVTFINSWFDPPKAKEAAFAMIDKGADVMYAERFGVSDAAKERGKLAVGNVIDTQDKYPDTVVASALWHMEPTIDAAIKAVKAGAFKADDYGHLSQMKAKGIRVELDESDDRFPKKIRNASKSKVPFVLIAGEEDRAKNAVSFRYRNGEQKNGVPIEDAIAEVLEAISSRAQV